jgi:hypothetical protein
MGIQNGKTGNWGTLHRADGSHCSCCGFPVLQKPVLGTADGEYRNCLGVRSFLLEIREASMRRNGVMIAATGQGRKKKVVPADPSPAPTPESIQIDFPEAARSPVVYAKVLRCANDCAAAWNGMGAGLAHEKKRDKGDEFRQNRQKGFPDSAVCPFLFLYRVCRRV